MQILFLILMAWLGAVFGSFLCCQARRMRLKETKKKRLGNRSICLHCHKQLKWYDNIPVISWVLLRGKCRFCHKKIEAAEVLSEIGMAVAFLAIGWRFLPIDFLIPGIMDWAIFLMILILMLGLGFLAIYDGLYGELPVSILTFCGICAIIILILQIGDFSLVSGFFDFNRVFLEIILPSFSGAALYGGIYLILYVVSKGKWVGDGDWILAAIIGLVLGSAWSALISLFVANLTACIMIYPLVKKRKNHQIYFGPFMVAAFVMVYVLNPVLASWF